MRIGASGAAYGGGNGGGKKRQKQGVVEREDKEDKSQEEGEEKRTKERTIAGWNADANTRGSTAPRPAHPGAEALDGNVRGRGCERKRAQRRQETARRTRTRARKVDQEGIKEKSWEEEGEGDAGATSKRMKPGLEHPGKTGARTRTTEWWRPWTGTSGVGLALHWSVRGCIRRKKQQRRGARAQEQGTVEREIKKNKSWEAGGGSEDGEADKRMGVGLKHPGHGRGVR